MINAIPLLISPPIFRRPLRSPLNEFERGDDGGGSAWGEHDEAQQSGQPGENEAEINVAASPSRPLR
jgi:hypothetical protein